MSFPGMWFVDRFGRRPVLLIGALAMFAGQIITGSVSKALPDSKPAGKALIAFSSIFIAGFAASWGPVAWVVCGESFPIRLSALCVTLGTGANWLFGLIIAFAAPQIQDRIGGCDSYNTDHRNRYLFRLGWMPGTGVGQRMSHLTAASSSRSSSSRRQRACLSNSTSREATADARIDALYLSNIPAVRTGIFMTQDDRRKIESLASKLEAEKERDRTSPV